MGRPRAAARRKKEEKAKVKLKGHTTKFLPKGQNITKTAFKVRKIVLPQQLKSQDGTQPLTKRKLNTKEVLSKLGHYSSVQRLDGLTGLTELLSQMDHAQLASNLYNILNGLGQLVIDKESRVRVLSSNIMASVLQQIGEIQLLPFDSVLGSYLSCAMTHIQHEVQEDSLVLFDALLESTPAVAAACASRLLPCVVDMISRARSDLNSSRQLSVQLSSNLLSTTWRAKVFGRLQGLLVVSLNLRKDRVQSAGNIFSSAHEKSVPITIDHEKQFYIPLYNSLYATPVCLTEVFQKSVKSSKQLLDDDVQLRSFVETIMPLMLASWTEVNPLSSHKSNHRTEDLGLPLQSTLILLCVLEIIDLLWQHLDLWDEENSRKELTSWFTKKYLDDITRCLGKGFPYTARAVFELDNDDDGNIEKSQGRRKKSETNKKTLDEISELKKALTYLFKDKSEQSIAEAVPKCVLQNLILCQLMANLYHVPPNAVRNKICESLIAYLDQWGGNLFPWSDYLLRTLRCVFEKSCSWKSSLDPLLSAVVTRYQVSSAKPSVSHKVLSSKLCDLLGEISINSKFHHMKSCESFRSWIMQLPASLGSENISFNKLCIFSKLASMNNINFQEGLHSSFDSLLCAVTNFKLLEGENQSEKEAALASLFYWIRKWSKDQVLSLKKVLLSDDHTSLKNKIFNVLVTQKEKFPELENASWLVYH